MDETEMEKKVFEYLKRTNNYCCLRRQFCIKKGMHRFDIVGVDNNIRLWIFELKVSYSNIALGQILDYAAKVKPAYACLVFANGEPSNIPNMNISIYKWYDDTLIPIVENVYRFGACIPDYIAIRLNAYYQRDILGVRDKFYGTKLWDNYCKKRFAHWGLKTDNALRYWWDRKNTARLSSRALKEFDSDFTLERFIREDDGSDQV